MIMEKTARTAIDASSNPKTDASKEESPRTRKILNPKVTERDPALESKAQKARALAVAKAKARTLARNKSQVSAKSPANNAAGKLAGSENERLEQAKKEAVRRIKSIQQSGSESHKGTEHNLSADASVTEQPVNSPAQNAEMRHGVHATRFAQKLRQERAAGQEQRQSESGAANPVARDESIQPDKSLQPAKGVHRKEQARADKSEKTKEKREAPPIIGATALLAAKYPSYFADTNDNRSRSESRIVFVVASLILAAIAIGWTNWNSVNFQAEGDFVYNSGLIGGIMMLCVLLYALRKRVKFLRKAGNMETWYYFHLTGGVLGPFIIVFHSSFTIKSINSGVALFTMLLIVFSGVFGRYIYTRIGYRLHRRLLAIKETEKALLEDIRNYQSPIGDVIERRLSKFAMACLVGPRSIFRLPVRLLAIRTASAACYVKASDDLNKLVRNRAQSESWSKEVYRLQLAKEKDKLRAHINSVAEIAQSHLFERLLVRWRILHIPFLYILLVTGLAHVLAVHMY